MKVILITGASGAIGQAIAESLAAEETMLCLHYGGDEGGVNETKRLVEAAGGQATIYQADLSDSEACRDLVAKVHHEHGQLDGLVNNAGLNRDALAIRMKEEDFDLVYKVNQKAPFILMQEAGKIMMRQRSGSIVNISSIVGLKGNPGQINYAGAKAALIAMTKTLAMELGSRGVTVNCVAPGFIETPMTDVLPEKIQTEMRESIALKKFGTPQDVAGVCRFLLSEEAQYITAQCFSVDGGMNR